MKRKSIILVLIAVLLLIGLAIYFRPLHFSVPDEISQIAIVLNEYAVSDGKPTIDSAEYPVTSPEQRRAIRALLEKTTYRRTTGTLFSDGSMSDVGNRTLAIYIYDGDSLADSILASSSGKIAVQNKTYYMKNSEQLIAQIIEIAKQTD